MYKNPVIFQRVSSLFSKVGVKIAQIQPDFKGAQSPYFKLLNLKRNNRFILISLLIISFCLFFCSCNVSGQIPSKERDKVAENTSNENNNANSEVKPETESSTKPAADTNDKDTKKPSVDVQTKDQSKPAEPKIEVAETPSEKEMPTKGYYVIVDISDQKVYIYKDGAKLKNMICSTGNLTKDDATPVGNFTINESGQKRGEWFYSNTYKEGAKYWVGFIGGNFLFHSVPMDENKNIIKSEADKLGTPASHGCIRLSVDDAYWFYKNVPDSTKLVIQD